MKNQDTETNAYECASLCGNANRRATMRQKDIERLCIA